MSKDFAMIGLDLIAPSLTNPRKSFNATKLQELADSIQASGVHQPVLLRYLPSARLEETFRSREPGALLVSYELVCGERRYRASKMAGVREIPALIRELSDDQVREIQIVENLQRDDLSELEEAEGYDALMQHSGLTAEQVGTKIGKSKSYVYAKLKLLDLSLECKENLRAGLIDYSRALLIARIPDTQLQAKALDYAIKPDWRGEAPSVRSFQEWLQTNVMLRLDKATFSITDARLVPDAGACLTCPKRTGANPDLFADVDSADLCTDPECFHGKEGAHRAMLIAKANARGLQVIEGKEALEMLPPGTRYPSGFTDLDATFYDHGIKGNAPSLREQLGKDAKATVLFEHPRTKVLMELMPDDQAEAALQAKGLLETDIVRGLLKSTASKANAEQDLKRLQAQVERETGHAVRSALLSAAKQAVRDTSEQLAGELLCSILLRAWLITMIDTINETDMAAALGYTFADGEDEQEALTHHIRACSKANLCRATAIIMMDENQYSMWDTHEPLVLNALMEILAIDAKALTKKATAGVKAEYTEQLRTLKTQLEAKKPAIPLNPAAQPEHAPGKAKKTPAKPKARLSADEAQSGIAAAMQDMEQAQTAAPDTAPVEDAKDRLYREAVELVRREQKVSVRLLKNGLSLGYGSVQQLLTRMEQDGIITAADAMGARELVAA